MNYKNREVKRRTSQSSQTFQSCSFGDTCKAKPKTTIRIAFQNLNGFEYTSKYSTKSDIKSTKLRQLIQQKQIDAIGLAELNINWGKLPRHQTLPQICNTWFETSKTTLSYNLHEHRGNSIYQPGGTAIISTGDLALRHHKHEYDKRQLGRWSSQSYRGKNNVHTRLVSVYVPHPTALHGPRKVLCQQHRAVLSKNITTPPLLLFWEDFWAQLDEWIAQGDQLIIAGDWNTNTTSSTFLKPFTQRTLIPAIASLHGQTLPPTFNSGSSPIDEIFISTSLKITAAGYLEHGTTLGDHCPLWVDIDRTAFIGANGYLKPTYNTRRLKTNDPRTVKRYLSTLHNILHSSNIYQLTDQLHKQIQHNQTLSAQQKHNYETIDRIREEAMHTAEKRCRTLKMGNVEWSPTLQRSRDIITYYLLTLRKLKGKRVSSRLLIRLSKKIHINYTSKNIPHLKEKIQKAFQTYKEHKKNHQILRESFLEDLAQALETHGNGKKANIIKSLKYSEQQRSMFRKLAYINKKI